MSADVFISFATPDRRVALTLCQALEGRGFKCWISARDILPGENFQSAIVKAIRGAKIMLLVFTANSNNSEEMNKELALASQSRLVVVPLRIEDVAPSDAFAYEFATRQWIDFFADWELAIQQLGARIEAATQVATATAADAREPVAEAAAAETIEAAPEPRSFATESDDAAPLEAEPAAETPARPARRGLFVAAAVAAVAAVALGVVAANMLKPEPPKSGMRAMEIVRPVAPPPELQKVSVDAAAPAAPADAAAAAPKPKHKKAMEKVRDNDVPY
jgi:hypothetical protein